MGALPRPLLEIIVGNGAWLQIPEVRRALLSNPRLGTDQITRVLRLMPKHELKLAAMQTAYPHGRCATPRSRLIKGERRLATEADRRVLVEAEAQPVEPRLERGLDRRVRLCSAVSKRPYATFLPS